MLLTATESSTESYYGEQGLYFVGTDGQSCLVPRRELPAFIYKTISRLIIEGFIINGFVWQRDFMLYVLFQRRMVQSILLSGVQNPMNLLLSMDVSKLY